ncbi:hypothetical protein [Nostoc sp.]|uniref:hypothetical protein n=1 Tax=Nostoc sp. TaxID=1180 RepID=UPI002FF7AAAD
MKISAIVKGSICLLGLVSVGNILAAPASAGQGQASARGAVTIVRPSGSSISVSGEVVAAPGTDFSAVDVEIQGPVGEGTNQETVAGLIVTPTATTAATTNSTTIQGAIAALITGYTNLEDVTALVRAAGASGGLE